jgi:hypothetical protein
VQKQIAFNRPQMTIPLSRLFERAVARGYAVPRNKNASLARATSNRRLIGLKLEEIVQRYNSIITGLRGYYAFVNRFSDL